MTDGSRLSGPKTGSPPQDRQKPQAPGSQQEGAAEEVDAYVKERTAAQSRKIELSMTRKAGYAPSADPQDKELQGSAQRRTDHRYDPKRW